MKSFLFFCLIGQLAALDRGADPAVELRTVEGAVVGFGVELVLVHDIGGVEDKNNLVTGMGILMGAGGALVANAWFMSLYFF